MTFAIPDSVVEDVRAASDIVNVISDYVVLRKKGKNYLGLCPFHHEKTPSFTVTPDKQMFYCFGCNTGGNVFTFLMKRENLTFAEAVRHLADKAGIAVPEQQRDDGERERRDKAFNVNEVAKNFYRHVLTTSELAQKARDYIARRGLSPAIVEKFSLGFAPPAWDGLKNYLARKGLSEEAMARLGLILPRSGGGGYYDRFRNRLMFPIFDARGRTIGFGGRVLDDSTPKYLNSSETELFDKGKNLYALNLALPSIREEGVAIVAEGYMDIITAHQHGITNMVASLGTALTRDQGKLLLRYAGRVILVYDSDDAGQAAAARGGEILQDLGLRVEVAVVPAGKDPDDFIRSRGPQAFREEVLHKAQPFVEYLLDKMLAKIDATRIEGKLRAVAEIIPYLARIANQVEAEEYIKKYASRLGVTVSSIQEELRRYQGKSWNQRDKNAKKSYTSTMSASGGLAGNDARSKAELFLARYMMESPEAFAKVEEALGMEFPENLWLQKITAFLGAIVQSGQFSPGAIFDKLSAEETGDLSRLLNMPLPEKNLELSVAGCIETLRGQAARTRREKLLEEIRQAENEGNEELRKQLLVEYQALLG